MDKELKQHNQFMTTEIENISNKLLKTKKWKELAIINDEIKKLSIYHNEVIRNFQHERLIHLLVTFFFAGLLLISISATIIAPSLVLGEYAAELANLFMFINLILLITELFYIRHYYQLENGTQSLYQFSKKLHELESLSSQNHKH